MLSAVILEAEIRRIAMRRAVPQTVTTGVLDVVELLEVDPTVCRTAGLLPPVSLRTLDALHVAAALVGGVDRFVTYDRRQAKAAEAVGIAVTAPGAEPQADPAARPGPD